MDKVREEVMAIMHLEFPSWTFNPEVGNEMAEYLGRTYGRNTVYHREDKGKFRPPEVTFSISGVAEDITPEEYSAFVERTESAYWSGKGEPKAGQRLMKKYCGGELQRAVVIGSNSSGTAFAIETDNGKLFWESLEELAVDPDGPFGPKAQSIEDLRKFIGAFSLKSLHNFDTSNPPDYPSTLAKALYEAGWRK